MSRATLPVSGKPYGMAAVCRVWRLARSGIYRRQCPRRRTRHCDGTIIAETVGRHVGTDLTTTFTGEGQAAVFIAVDLFRECVGPRRAARFERRSARACADTSAGSQRASPRVSMCGTLTDCNNLEIEEIALLGIECCLPLSARQGQWLRRAVHPHAQGKSTLGPHLRGTGQALLEFRETYNNSWLIQRHGFISPAAFRQQELNAVKQAA